MNDETFCIIALAGLHALSQKVVAEGGDDVLCMLFFVYYPAGRLIDRLCVGVAFKLGQHTSGFENSSGIFEHRFDAGAIVINSARHLAMPVAGVWQAKAESPERECECELSKF